MAYGATREEWEHFSRRLGLREDLLPVVSDPTAKISALSQLGKPGKDGKLPKPGKVPSLFNSDREVVGLPRWTQMRAAPAAIAQWRIEPAYGMCIQTRYARAIDVDVPNRVLAAQYRQVIEDVLGIVLPERYRPDTGKFLQVFIFDEPIIWPKRRIPVDGGVIEFLGDGQQFIACGTHPDGEKYAWQGGLPETIPVIPVALVEKLYARLDLVYATGESAIARAPGDRLKLAKDVADPRYDWLVDNWQVFDTGPGGQLFLECPFEGEHSSDSGISSTAYFPAGVGGYRDGDGAERVYERGHWRCLHAHCEGRSDQDFDEACGFAVSSFPNLPALAEQGEEEEGDRYLEEPTRFDTEVERGAGGRIKWTATMLVSAIAEPRLSRMWIAYDHFLDQIVWAEGDWKPGKQQWRAFTDDAYMELRIRLERRGFYEVGKEMLREATFYVARQRPMDSAMEWIARLEWDGVRRIDKFFSDYFGVEQSDYVEAVSAYTWTALAGRAIKPGVQADMVPVLIGAQGTRKSSAILAMAPSESAYVKINLNQRDDDLSRKLRGKLVGDFDELKGLATRESEDIKSWLTQRTEEWVPKFKEFGTNFPRRLIFIGSGNRKGILADPTGERRWLPMEMPPRGKIDVERITQDREQLWAEGAARYRAGGIAWQKAEMLAKREHGNFKVKDVWREYIEKWMATSDVRGAAKIEFGFTMAEVITGALSMSASAANPGVMLRVERALTDLGLTEGEDGVWRVEKRYSVLD